MSDEVTFLKKSLIDFQKRYSECLSHLNIAIETLKYLEERIQYDGHLLPSVTEALAKIRGEK